VSNNVELELRLINATFAAVVVLASPEVSNLT
jgi:hypothetical protein